MDYQSKLKQITKIPRIAKRLQIAERPIAVYPGARACVLRTEHGFGRLVGLSGQSPQVEMLPGLTRQLQAVLNSVEQIVSVLELTKGRFVIEAIPNNRPAFENREIYIVDSGRSHISSPLSIKQDVFRDLPMRALGSNRVALLTATDLVVVDLSGAGESLYLSETAPYQRSAIMSGMDLYCFDPHPQHDDMVMIACSDGYDSVLEVYQFNFPRDIELLDSVRLPERAVESSWFSCSGDYVGWSCVETNQGLREPVDLARLSIAGSVGHLTAQRTILSVDIPFDVFYGGLAYENADVDFYRTCITWLDKRIYIFRTAVGQLGYCDLDQALVTIVVTDEVEQVRSIFRLCERSYILMDSGTVYEVEAPANPQ